MRKYSLDREIASITQELNEITELKTLLRMKGWEQVTAIFQRVIQQFLQDVYDKCDKPAKHEIEIRCKKMVADALGKILSEIDSRVGSEDYLKDRLRKRAEDMAALKDKQELQQL